MKLLLIIIEGYYIIFFKSYDLYAIAIILELLNINKSSPSRFELGPP